MGQQKTHSTRCFGQAATMAQWTSKELFEEIIQKTGQVNTLWLEMFAEWEMKL